MHKWVEQLKTIRNARRNPEGFDSALIKLSALSPHLEKAFQLIERIVSFARSVFHETLPLRGLTTLILRMFDVFAAPRGSFEGNKFQEVISVRRRLLAAVLRLAAAIGNGDTTIMDGFIDNEVFSAKVLTVVATVARGETIERETLRHFQAFAASIHERAAAAAKRKIDTTDAPEEFTDAVTFEPMTEPVRLPSGQVLDRETVRKVLARNPINPFTMAALTIEECIPERELGERITEYIARKHAEKEAELCKKRSRVRSLWK
jgi:hypothetical protein